MKTAQNSLNIRQIAKARGISLASIAGRLGIARSNLSAIASGDRGVSLAMLKKISVLLACSLGELFFGGTEPRVFKDKRSSERLDDILAENYDGIDKTWTHHVMLAHHLHYRSAKRRP
jgi:transcriptional regulator with XRE-family HTH domain